MQALTITPEIEATARKRFDRMTFKKRISVNGYAGVCELCGEPVGNKQVKIAFVSIATGEFVKVSGWQEANAREATGEIRVATLGNGCYTKVRKSYA